MKLITTLMVLLGLSNAVAAFSSAPGEAEESKALFVKAIQSPDVARVMSSTADAEIISVRQVFILAGRISHTNYEVTYGIPDGTGGFSSNNCVALTLQYDHSSEEETDGKYFVPASESCRGGAK